MTRPRPEPQDARHRDDGSPLYGWGEGPTLDDARELVASGEFDWPHIELDDEDELHPCIDCGTPTRGHQLCNRCFRITKL